ncbi:hypothetical protein KNO15_08880 [Leifsonia shinshuensis]|uniref:hypothetical protein n=1 Tax=Leifsonia shinshuensis TaxID=150026 RepID=UPI001F5129A0|nr:hypothetical protein [Leifsonia shinshuensis]MCI0156809.1 hypothetical protein [Leifsonia shinshuensis]
MTDAKGSSTASGTRRTLVWSVLCTAIVVAVVTLILTLAVFRPHDATIGSWVTDFVKTSGFAGLCAVAAALVAFWSISRQLKVTRQGIDEGQRSSDRALEAQRTTADRNSWWQMFEWASSRAIPADKTEDPLPYAAILRTFEALAESATSPVQEAAVSGVMDEVAGREEGRRKQAATNSPSSEEYTGSELAALEAFVRRTANTPARSRAAESQLYEAQVIQAILKLESDESSDFPVVVREGPTTDLRVPDVLVEIDGVTVGVEVKRFTPASQTRSKKVLDQLRYFLSEGPADRILLVVPAELGEGVMLLESGIFATHWSPNDGTSSLVRALQEVARRS